jgi:glutamine amidotransferase
MFGFSAARPSAVQRSLLEEPNALKFQSQEHPDGWGIGYYAEGAVTPLLVRSINCAFADAEFADMATRVQARTVIAHVRRASCGPIALQNTHPFHHERWLFAHNGTVSRFEAIRQGLEAEIDPDLRRLAQGETDSERCFLLLLTRLRAHHPLADPCSVEAMGRAILETVAFIHGLADAGAPEPSSLTFILSDGHSLVAYRDGRSLHYSLSAPTPHRSSDPVDELMVASEVLSAQRTWSEVPTRGLIGLEDSRRLYRHDPTG